MLIQDLGWDAYFEAQWSENRSEGCVPARVVSQQRGMWRVAGDFEECWAEASGKLRKESEDGGDWPAVGDWIAAEIRAGRTNALIQNVLPRRSRFVRKIAGKQIAEQVIVANIDVALIVAALDGDFNVEAHRTIYDAMLGIGRASGDCSEQSGRLRGTPGTRLGVRGNYQ